MSSSVDIRPVRMADAGAIQAIYAPLVENTTISFETKIPSVAEMKSRIRSGLNAYPYLVAERQGIVVGYAYAGSHRTREAYRHSVDVSVYVAETARGLGIGRSLYAELLGQLAQAGFHAAFAGIALPNPASEALHQSVGFEPVGTYKEVGFKFGTWHDVRWWQRLLTGPATPSRD